ncbi:phage tail assembly protein [Escherichia coli]|uniref:phage tail assembly protein n=1 Tax=Escherichia coli TaxID=562 RepID=UPI000D6F10CA|nr:phage tail assembly protein [Escherichia coli]
MAELTFELKHGLLTGKGTADETLHKTVKLRELTASDVIDAQLAAERVVMGGNGKAVAYCSEVLMGLEMMRRQVAAIGNIPGPLDMKQLRMLHPADLELISTKAAALDEMLEEVATRGRTDAAGGGTDEPAG